MTNAKHTLHVSINNQSLLSFDHNKPIPKQQLEYLDNMDSRMNRGILLNSKKVEQPTHLQKAQFVANTMVNSLLNDEDTQAVAMCTYLGSRMPTMKQVKCQGSAEKGMKIEFIFEKHNTGTETEIGIETPSVEHVMNFLDPDKIKL